MAFWYIRAGRSPVELPTVVQVLLPVGLVEPAHVLGRINAMEATALMS